MSDAPPAAETSPDEIITSTPKPALNTEDWWSIWLGASILIVSLAAVWALRPADLEGGRISSSSCVPKPTLSPSSRVQRRRM